MMMVVAVIVIMFMIVLVPAEEGSDLHGGRKCDLRFTIYECRIHGVA
jgi:hypothetical protein